MRILPNLLCAQAFPNLLSNVGKGKGEECGYTGTGLCRPYLSYPSVFSCNAQAQDVPRMAADAETYWIFLRNLVNPHWLGRCRSARRTLVSDPCDTRVSMIANGYFGTQIVRLRSLFISKNFRNYC